MDTNINYTLVGAFVITLIAATIMAIIWLSAGFSVVPYSTYVIYSQESVSGLNIDGAVEFNGVNVGSVTSLELSKGDPHLVKVMLSIKSSTPISRGTIATLTSKGITGVAFIALKDTGTDMRPLVILPDEYYPVIQTGPSIFLRLDHALRSLTKNFDTIATSIRDLLDKDNLASIKQTLKSLDKVTTNLANNNERINVILANTTRVTEQLTPLVQYSASSMKTFNNQTLPITYRLLNNLNDVSRTLNDVTLQLKQNPSVLIRGAAPQPLGPGERK